MKKEEVKRLAELRKHIIGFYNSIEGADSAGTAVMKSADVAYFCETLVKSTDDILKPYVSFEE